MKLHKMTLAVLALLTMVSTAALGGIEYIDFEGLPYTLIGNGGSNIPNPSSVLTNDFMSQGVTFGKPGVSKAATSERVSFMVFIFSGLV